MLGARVRPKIGDVERGVAELVLATGLAPDVIGGLDPHAVTALVEAVERRAKADEWRHNEELLANILTAVGELTRVMAAFAGAKGRELPKSIRYPRPYDPPKPPPPAATRAELRQRFTVRT